MSQGIPAYENVNKTKGQLVVHEITPVLRVAGQKFPRYLEVNLKTFVVFRNLYLLIPRYLAESWLINTGLKFLCCSRQVSHFHRPRRHLGKVEV